jgi:[ribosomal protein S18]-alanine N-acetyltransferase
LSPLIVKVPKTYPIHGRFYGEVAISDGLKSNIATSLHTLSVESEIEWSQGALLHELQSPSTLILMAHYQGALRGFLIAQEIIDEVHLLVLAVHRESRRNGIARSLLSRLIRESSAILSDVATIFPVATKFPIVSTSALTTSTERSFQRILLEVRESNLGAQALYQSLGFTLDGKRQRYYSDTREDAHLYSLSLR